MSSPLKQNTTSLQELLEEINSLPTYVDTTSATASASDILSGKTAYVDGKKVTGNIPTNTSSNLTASGATVTVPAGYYSSQATKSVDTVTQATPSVSIDSAGKITATATQTAGYVSSGTKTGTKQLTTQAAKTITPGTSDQTAVSSGVYTTGAVTVKGDANLKAENIISGKSIFGVNGGIPNNGDTSQTMDGINTTSVTIPEGYTSGGTVSLDGSIDTAVDNAISALTEKGVTVPTGTKVDGLAALISKIEAKSFPNGMEWTLSNITDKAFSDCAYGCGIYVAASSSAGLYYSTDAKVWTKSNITSGCTKVNYANGMWVAGGVYKPIYYSTDGKTWTQSNITSIATRHICFGNGMWVIPTMYKGLYYSEDGKTWTQSNITSNTYEYTYYDNGLWVACTQCLYYSEDGKTWVKSNITNCGTYCGGIYYGNGVWVACDDTNGILYSTDGKVWTQSNVTSGNVRNPVNACGMWISGDYNGNVYYSTDGKTWTQSNVTNYNKAINVNGIWILTLNNTGLYYSVTWEPST